MYYTCCECLCLLCGAVLFLLLLGLCSLRPPPPLHQAPNCLDHDDSARRYAELQWWAEGEGAVVVVVMVAAVVMVLVLVLVLGGWVVAGGRWVGGWWRVGGGEGEGLHEAMGAKGGVWGWRQVAHLTTAMTRMIGLSVTSASRYNSCCWTIVTLLMIKSPSSSMHPFSCSRWLYPSGAMLSLKRLSSVLLAQSIPTPLMMLQLNRLGVRITPPGSKLYPKSSL